jgi:hypothetical protein
MSGEMRNRQSPQYRLEGDGGETDLVATGASTTEATHALDLGLADGLEVNYANGFKDTDLAFLRNWPLKRVQLLARTVFDLGPVERLSHLLVRELSADWDRSRLILGLMR